MTTDELIADIQRHRFTRQTCVCIVVSQPGSIGGTPTVDIERIQAGFDWDNGRLMLYPAKPLTALTETQIRAIEESARKGQSWHAYEAQKRLRRRITDLEKEVAGLRASLPGQQAACNSSEGPAA